MTETIEVRDVTLFVGTVEREAIHRRPIEPGRFVGETWMPADISGESDAVKQAAAQAWTPSAVAAYQAGMAEALGIGRAPTSLDINAERERRIAAGTIVTLAGYGDVPVQGGEHDIRNLQGLGMAALARISAGDTTTLTGFRDANNAMHDLTPPQVLGLWQLATAYVEAVYQASWAIKALNPIPTDYADDQRWP